jgi:hypothetical protein
LKRLIEPSAESLTSTLFGVGGEPATQLRLELSGRAMSDGQMVRKLDEVPPIAVTFIATAVAVAGIVQFPFVPRTGWTMIPPAGIGVDLVPTLSAPGRVSNSRQGSVGTSTDATPPVPAMTCTAPIVIPPTAATTAIASDRFINASAARVAQRHSPAFKDLSETEDFLMSR